MGNVKRTVCLGAMLAIVALLPAAAPAQDYRSSTEHYDALKRKAGGGQGNRVKRFVTKG